MRPYKTARRSEISREPIQIGPTPNTGTGPHPGGAHGVRPAAVTIPVGDSRVGKGGGVGSQILWVGIGGFVGANARYLLGRLLVGRVGDGFPVATLLVNVSGSFAIGVVLTLLIERWVGDPAWRLLIVVGFLGGYTTFSAYAFETLTLIERGQWTRAVAYVLASNAAGLLAGAAGMVLARSWER